MKKEKEITCQNCGEKSLVKIGIDFVGLGFPESKCPKCGNKNIQPLKNFHRGGYIILGIIGLLITIGSPATTNVFDNGGNVMIFIAAIALYKDYKIRKQFNKFLKSESDN